MKEPCQRKESLFREWQEAAAIFSRIKKSRSDPAA
jgi:hypothetical protein